MAEILIVDDDSDLTAVVGAIVSTEGHVARRAHQGQEGLTSIYERSADVIIVDLEMPVLDGLAMVRRLRAFEPDGASIPFILMSGQQGLAQIAESLGTPYFLSKPFTMDALLLMVARALREPWTPSDHSSRS